MEELTQKGPVGVYTALLTQSGVDAPVSTVLDNTIGDITFEYASSGEYRIISDGLFTQDKTFFMSQTTSPGTPIFTTMTYQDSSTIYLRTLMSRIGYQDGFLLNTPIEIRVYSKSH